MNNKTAGIIFSVLSAFMIGSNFVIVKHQLNYISFPSLLFLWFAFASFFLFLMILIRKDIKFFVNFKKEIKPALTMGAIGIVTAVLFFASLSHLTSSFFAFIMRIATIVTVFLGIIVLKERFTKIEIIGAVTAIIGTFILTYTPGSFLTLGIIIGFTAALTIGVQDFIWKVIVKEIHPITMNFYRTFAIAIVLFAYLSMRGGVELVPSSQMPLLILGTLISPVFGVMFLMMAMSKLEASKVVTIRTIEPFIVVMYAFIFFSAIPSAQELLGGTIIVLGVATMTLFHKIYKKSVASKQHG